MTRIFDTWCPPLEYHYMYACGWVQKNLCQNLAAGVISFNVVKDQLIEDTVGGSDVDAHICLGVIMLCAYFTQWLLVCWFSVQNTITIPPHTGSSWEI